MEYIRSKAAQPPQSIVKIGRLPVPQTLRQLRPLHVRQRQHIHLRYRLTRKLDIESTVGNQTGGAIYYRVEFD